MPLATIPFLPSSSSSSSSKSSLLSAFKKSPKNFQMSYTISTPRSANAKFIEKDLPTVIYLHPVYLSQASFHAQFADPNLRRFNLVTLDFRGHGSTVSPLTVIPEDYSLATAADDVLQIMDIIGVEKAHLAGVSMGATVALYAASKQPHRVASVFAMSPLLQVEPKEVQEGREEIGVYWREGVATGEVGALLDAARGAIELLFGERPDEHVSRIVGVALPLAIRNWAESGAKGSEIHRRVTIHPFTRRPPFSHAELARITAPVLVTFSGEDLVQTLEGTEELCADMRKAGVSVGLETIPRAAHVPNTVAWAPFINPLHAKFILSHLPKDAPVPPAPMGLGAQQSPWYAELYRDQGGDDDSE